MVVKRSPPRGNDGGKASVVKRMRLAQFTRERPYMDAGRGFVRLVEACARDLNSVAGLQGEDADIVTEATVQAGFPVLLHLRHGNADGASDVFMSVWRGLVFTMGLAPTAGPPMPEPGEPLPVDAEDREYLAVFNAAVGEYLRSSGHAAEARRVLRRIMATLDLSQDETARMFGVAGETIRRWERGLAPIPAKRMADLTRADAALSRLLDLFRPERLPVAVRRAAELFEGERAVDWILRGRIAEVADRYDTALLYQA